MWPLLIITLFVVAADLEKSIKGLKWEGAAIGTAAWSGVLLSDVLRAAGIDERDSSISHIQVGSRFACKNNSFFLLSSINVVIAVRRWR